MPHAAFSVGSIHQLWNDAIAPNSPRARHPAATFPLCAVPAGPCPAALCPAHICVQHWGKAPFPEGCPCAGASWTPGDPCREQLISHLIKWGLQSHCSLVSCHTDLSFKAQGRKKPKTTYYSKHERSIGWN